MLIHQQLLAALIAAAVITPALAEAPAAPTVEISAPRDAPALKASEVGGVFATETGRNIVIENYGDVLRVRYGRKPAKMLRLAPSGDFVSADGVLSMRVERNVSPGVEAVHLTMPASWL